MRSRTFALVLLSLLAWETWEGVHRFVNPWGDLRAEYTDHFSHMNWARLFPRVGIDIWRQPVKQMLRPLTDEEIRALPADAQAGASFTGGIFEVPGWPVDKPMMTSWSHNPRLYPPGDMLLVAPVALLYHYTGLSFAGANRLLLMLIVLFAHVSIYFYLERALRGEGGPPWLRWCTFALVYFEVLHRALDGFYDVAVLCPLVLCARYLEQRRGLAAIVAFCVAATLHFRAFFYAPWVLYGLFLVVREEQWRRWKTREWVAVAVVAALSFASLAPFLLLWPSLVHLPVRNFVHLLASPHPIAFVVFVPLTAVTAWTIYKARAWFDLATLGWLILMMVTVREAYGWHAVIAVLPWLGAPVIGTPRTKPVYLARFIYVLLCAGVVFHECPAPIWLRFLW